MYHLRFIQYPLSKMNTTLNQFFHFIRIQTVLYFLDPSPFLFHISYNH